MKRLKVIALLAVLLLVLAWYWSGKQIDGINMSKEQYIGGAPAPDFTMDQSRQTTEESFVRADQKLIRTAEIALDVQNIDAALAEIRKVANAAGGYTAELSISGVAKDRQAWLVLRVPAAKLDQVLAEIEVVVEGRRTSLRTGDQDITLQYMDLEARIRNAQRQEERLLEILDRAGSVEELLQVEQELARVRGQLESMTAEFRYLSDRVDLSTIAISLRETPTASPTITGSGLRGVWQRGIAELINSVNVMLIGLGNLLVFLFALSPYLFLFALVGIPGAIMTRKLWVKKQRNNDA